MNAPKDFTTTELKAIVAIAGMLSVCLIAYYLKDGRVLLGLFCVAQVVHEVKDVPPKEKGDWEGI